MRVILLIFLSCFLSSCGEDSEKALIEDILEKSPKDDIKKPTPPSDDKADDYADVHETWLLHFGANTPLLNSDNSSYERCSAITVDIQDNIYCTGRTDGGLAEESGGGNDVFVMKLNSKREIQWVTQLGAETTGGGDNAGFEECDSIEVDLIGNVYCSGYTDGAIGENSGGNDDAFVLKLNPEGELLWVTQLGADTVVPGGDTGEFDYCNGLDIDLEGNVYCAGFTDGSIGEANGGNNDAFVLKLNTDGELQWVTQLGANTMAPGGDNSSEESCEAIEIQIIDNAVYCAGNTTGSFGEENADISNSQDAFVMKLNTDGELQWVTQLGHLTRINGWNNNRTEYVYDMTLAAWGDVLVTGNTTSSMSEPMGGVYDPFIARISKQGDLKWITQLGDRTVAPEGNNRDADNCSGIAIDRFDNIYCGGWATGDIGEPHGGGTNDIFLLKLNPDGKFNELTQN